MASAPKGSWGAVSESGRLRHGEGTRGSGARRRRVLELPTLTLSETSKPPARGGAMNIAKNMKLLAHHPLDGFGNIGEGLALQKARDKRRVLWLAHMNRRRRT